MLKMDQYINTIETMYPDGYQRERVFRESGDMVAPPSVTPARGFIGRLIEAMALWQSKRSGRLALRELTDEQLCDIGISRQQAREEAQKASFPSWPTRSL